MSIEQHRNKLKSCAIDYDKNSEKYKYAIQRLFPLEKRPDDIRSEFARDYTRVLHCMGYRRLKHKTQVFFNPENDHICTRIEHVSIVESASYTIANFLGLNEELVKVIAISHDIGHAPFGHLGETILKEITISENLDPFWHEKNGLHFVDNIEYLYDSYNNYSNLNLTYAVRDGIISHCGEVNQNGLKPRNEAIDLNNYITKNQYDPYTWEGCVVKIADKISYLGRDIEDAKRLKILDWREVIPLLEKARNVLNLNNLHEINTTSLMNVFIIDLCKNSSEELGLRFSDEVHKLMDETMKFSIEKIYNHEKLEPYKRFATYVIQTLYKILVSGYEGENTKKSLNDKKQVYPSLFNDFSKWIDLRWDFRDENKSMSKFNIAYKVSRDEREYKKAVLDYISGMTDNYAIRMFEDICSFK